MNDSFRKNIIDIYGKQGQDWFDSLANTTLQLAKKYNLSDLQPVDNMSFNYVAKGYQGEKPIILKLGMNHKAIAREAEALNAYHGIDSPKVLSLEDGLILMERAVPGSTLKDFFPDRDIQAVETVSNIIKDLHKISIPDNNNFYSLEYILKILDNELDIPKNIIKKARKLRDELLGSSQRQVLLHGDLHHDNILKNGNGWMVIDPKGFIGDPCYEVCAFISNPIPDLLDFGNPKEIIDNRIQLFSQNLGFSEQRIRDWHFVQVVIGFAWCLEDRIDHSYFKKLASLLLQ